MKARNLYVRLLTQGTQTHTRTRHLTKLFTDKSRSWFNVKKTNRLIRKQKNGNAKTLSKQAS